MIKWEYKTVEDALIDRELNDLGIDGWELVNFVVTRNSDGDYPKYEYIFKRPKVD